MPALRDLSSDRVGRGLELQLHFSPAAEPRARSGCRPPIHFVEPESPTCAEPIVNSRKESTRSVRGSQAMSAAAKTTPSNPCAVHPTDLCASSAPWPAPKMYEPIR